MEADSKLFEIWNQFDFDVDPINSESEKKVFFSNRDYNPQFRYHPKEKLEQFQKNLLSISSDNNWISNVINQRRDIMLTKINMVLNRKAENFTSGSMNLFGFPSQELVSAAKEDLKLEEESELKELSDKDALRMISRTLGEMKLMHWNAQLKDDMCASAKVDSAHKKVYIRKGEKFSFAGVERLIVHELQTHVIRMENSARQKYKIFQIGFPRYLETEEGLAAYNEEQSKNLLHNKIKKIYAGRVIAVSLALEKGFADTFAELSKHFSDEDSWRLALRAKRGLLDTSEAGGFTKDYIYLSGKLKVKKFFETEKELGIADIYRGRISLEHVEFLRNNLSEVQNPLYLPSASPSPLNPFLLGI